MSRIIDVECQITDWSDKPIPPAGRGGRAGENEFRMTLKKFIESDSTKIQLYYPIPDGFDQDEIDAFLSSQASSYRNAAHALGYGKEIKVSQRGAEKTLYIYKKVEA